MSDDTFPRPEDRPDLVEVCRDLARGLQPYATGEWQRAHIWFKRDESEVIVIDSIKINDR